jgi:hypothetical protein
MAILYRAIWSDNGTDLVARVRAAFSDWIEYKSHGEFVGTETDIVIPDGSMRLRLKHESSDQANAPIRSVLRASLVETKDNGSRWTTTVQSWEGPRTADDPGSQGGWVWVDVDAVTHDSLEHVIVGAPRFVRQLLTDGITPNRFGLPLTSNPLKFMGEEGAEELAQLITAIDRDVPIVVFAPLPQNFYFQDLPSGVSVTDWFDEAIKRAANMSAGLALVCRLDTEATHLFKAIMGEAYEVRDGAFRIYLPGVDPALDEGWKHRYTVPVRFMRYREMAGRLINRAISLRAGARRAPDSYEVASQLLSSAGPNVPDELQARLLHFVASWAGATVADGVGT